MSVGGQMRGVKRGARRNGARGARPATLTVRPAATGDLVPLGFFFDTVLRKDYFLRRGQLRDILSGKHHQAFVAELDGVLVGIAITTRGTRLINALVHPAYRGLAIGKRLVRASGATEVRAKLDMSSGDPRGFYKALGFKPTKQLNGKGNIELMRVPGNARRNNGRSRRLSQRPAVTVTRSANGNGRRTED